MDCTRMTGGYPQAQLSLSSRAGLRPRNWLRCRSPTICHSCSLSAQAFLKLCTLPATREHTWGDILTSDYTVSHPACKGTDRCASQQMSVCWGPCPVLEGYSGQKPHGTSPEPHRCVMVPPWGLPSIRGTSNAMQPISYTACLLLSSMAPATPCLLPSQLLPPRRLYSGSHFLCTRVLAGWHTLSQPDGLACSQTACYDRNHPGYCLGHSGLPSSCCMTQALWVSCSCLRGAIGIPAMAVTHGRVSCSHSFRTPSVHPPDTRGHSSLQWGPHNTPGSGLALGEFSTE